MSVARPIPARVHVLLASDAPIGVIIRRGPSKSVCTIGWDRRNDTFTLGQWLRGRIYERRSDLSPDGRHLIYFAMNGRWKSRTRGSWTAISKAPYLKAIGLWAKGDCWHGGGLFLDERRFWLNDGCGHDQLIDPPRLKRLDKVPGETANFGGECPGVYYLRLQRDGWALACPEQKTLDRAVTAFEKRFGSRWLLRKLAHATVDHPPGKGCYYDEHELEHLPTGRKIPLPDWEWADQDGSRLVWVAGGKLFSGRLDHHELVDQRELRDFNDMAFEAIAAPY